MKPPALIALALVLGTGPSLFAQSSRQGTVLVRTDFSSGAVEPGKWRDKSWNVPGAWELRDGALVGLWDRSKNGAPGHGPSIRANLQVHDVRVSYRVKLEAAEARTTMLINAKLPKAGDDPLWHIGRVACSLKAERDISIDEDDFSIAPGHPKVARNAKLFLGAYRFMAGSTTARTGLKAGQWHRIVVEAVGTTWTVWVDGKMAVAATMKRSDVDKYSIDFISDGPIRVDDIVIEQL